MISWEKGTFGAGEIIPKGFSLQRIPEGAIPQSKERCCREGAKNCSHDPFALYMTARESMTVCTVQPDRSTIFNE